MSKTAGNISPLALAKLEALNKAPKHEPPRVIYVDVDGTLIQGGECNWRLVRWLRDRKSEGFRCVLWSSAGEEHAREMAETWAVDDVFDYILPKPGYIVDDQGWKWTRYTEIISERKWSK